MQISISNIVKGTVIGSAFTAISRYFTRVTQAGAIYEKPLCVESGINSSQLLQQASMLILPSGYKGGTAYAELPSNGNGDLTWTRASDAWRTNADGLIQRVPWNLASYSEQFDNASWLKSYATVTANSTTAPDGNTTADKIVGVGNNPLIYQSTSTLTGKYTFSIYGKKGELSWLRLTNSSAGTNAVWFDLNNGAVGTLVGAGNSANITSVGNGWYRCEFIINSFDSSQPTDLVIACTNADNTTTGYTGNSVDGLFIWGAQLVEGTTAQTYLPTTDRLNFPRLSYMYGSCPSALLEPQRTNSIRNSSMVGAVAGSPGTLPTNWPTPGASILGLTRQITNVGTVGGINYIDIRFTGTATNSDTLEYEFESRTQISAASGQTWTASLWLALTNLATSPIFATAIRESTSANVTVSNTLQSQTLTNNLVRISQTRTLTGATTERTSFSLRASVSVGQTYDFTIRIAQPQMELGAYATTPIPTTSATATRVADSFSRNNIFTNGLITSSGGTWFVELRGNLSLIADNAPSGFWLGTSSTGTNSNGTLYFRQGGGSQRTNVWKYESGTATQLYTTTTDTTKIAIKWNGSTADIFANGTKVVSATSFTATILENFVTTGVGRPFFIQQMALFPTPLSDTDCELLTGTAYSSYESMATALGYYVI